MLPYRLSCILLSLMLLAGANAPVERFKEDTSIILRLEGCTEPTIREINIEFMQKEIALMWGLYLDAREADNNDPRRDKIHELAWYLAAAIDRYQHEPVNWKESWNPRAEGFTLPKRADIHLVLGSMATYETKLDPKLKGGLGEVGLLQCHTWCLDGNKRSVVREDYRLGTELAVRFFTKMYGRCGIDIDSIKSLKARDKAWSKPISVYGAGMLAWDNERGVCVKKSFAKRRVRRMKKYRKKIRQKTGEGNDRVY